MELSGAQLFAFPLKCLIFMEIKQLCVFVCLPANSKSVNWQLGRDGDVLVVVIGEVDEFKSKFICIGEEKKTSVLQNNNW